MWLRIWTSDDLFENSNEPEGYIKHYHTVISHKPWRWRHYVPPKRWYPLTTLLHSVLIHQPWRKKPFVSPKRLYLLSRVCGTIFPATAICKVHLLENLKCYAPCQWSHGAPRCSCSRFCPGSWVWKRSRGRARPWSNGPWMSEQACNTNVTENV
jgi:hypothetical protein